MVFPVPENKDLYDSLKDTYTPPEKTYGPGTATPGETGYAFTKANPAILKGIDPKILEFFGYKGGPNIPVELLKMIMEGSIMGGPEAGFLPPPPPPADVIVLNIEFEPLTEFE